MGRSPCCEKNGLKRGPWTPEEDQKLMDYIRKNGYGNWRTLPKNAGLQRCGKSCRLRWTNYLRPDIKRGKFSFEEEETIIQLHSILGNKWSAIAAQLPGRTDNEIKNYWNTNIRKRLLRMGIDPVTHSPRLDLLDWSSVLNSPSLYNSSQFNMSGLMGVDQPQTLPNPELLRLATSLFWSHESQSLNFLHQNQPCNAQFPTPLLEYSNLLQTPVQEFPTCAPCVSFSSEAQIVEPKADQFSSVFGSQSCQLNEWQTNGLPSTLTEDHQLLLSYGYDYQSSDHVTSNVQYPHNNVSTGFSFGSVLSTPSSSPTPLNSNSTCVNNSCTAEDERESYSSNMLKLEISDILDVNELM